MSYGSLEGKTRGHKWLANQPESQLNADDEEVPNPLCKCGCGLEVAMPWHVRLQGHTDKRTTEEQRQEIIRLRSEGCKFKVLSGQFKLSVTTIRNIVYGYRFKRAQISRMRASEIKLYCDYQKMKKALSEVKKRIKENGKL